MLNKKELFDCLKINLMTKSQKQAVLSGETPILLSASAGSGKTFVLSTRVIFKLLNSQSPIYPQDLLVVTFAKSAAKEMFERISLQMKNLITKYPNNKNLYKQYSLLSQSNITTIDSFCSNLLREKFELANISPNFRIAEETEMHEIKSKILEEIFEEQYSKSPQTFQMLCDYFSLNNDSSLKIALLEIYQKSRTYPFPKIYLSNIIHKYKYAPQLDDSDWAKEVKNGIYDNINKAKFLLLNSLTHMDDPILRKSFSPHIKNFIGQLETVANKINLAKYSEMSIILNQINFPNLPRYNKKTNAFDQDLCNEIKSKYINPAKKIISSSSNYIITKEQYEDDLNKQLPILQKLVDLSFEFYEKMEQKKQKLNLLEFSDLLLKSLELLATPYKDGFTLTDVGKEMSKYFKEILVDEFQDVNKAQDMLFHILSDNGKNLFMVGDIKQSIYRFRQADPDVFLNHKQIYSKDNTKGTVINLNNNFRSQKEVTNATNFLFGQIMTENFGGSNYKNGEQLFSSSNIISKKNMFTEFHIITNDSDEESNIEYEAKHIANKIKLMLTEKFEINDGNQARPCEPKDFAILFRSGRKIPKILGKYFSELNIPFISSNDIGYLDSYEVSITISLLKIINNPLLDIPLCAVLLSPIFNFSTVELAEIRIACKDKPLYTAIKESEYNKCNMFIKELSILRQKSAVLTISQLLQEIYNHDSFFSLFALSNFNDQKFYNLQLLLHHAEEYEQFSDYGLSGFLRTLDKYTEKDSINLNSSCNTQSESANAVNIMTIHKSKGLEFPIVFVSFCAKRFNEKDFNKPILFSSKFGISLKHSNPSKFSRYNTLQFNASVLSERNDMKAEELRLLYVAMTRAKNKLILTAIDNDQKYKNIISSNSLLLSDSYCKSQNSFYGWLLAGFMRHKDSYFGNSKINFNSEEFNCSIKIKNKFKKAKINKHSENASKSDYNIIEKIRKQINFKYINESLSEIPSKLAVTDITKSQRNIALKTPSFSDTLTSSEIGTATHEFLQYANFKNAKSNIENEIKRLVKFEYITLKQAKHLNIEKLKCFFNSKIYNLIEKANIVQREKSFIYEISAKELYSGADDSKIIIQGIIDCVIEKNNQLTIVDYKTDKLSENDLKKLYTSQLIYYKKALEKLTKKPVTACYIYSVHLNKTISCYSNEQY